MLKVNAVLTETLTHPDSEHVKLQEPVINILSTLQVHKEMIYETPTPWWNGS